MTGMFGGAKPKMPPPPPPPPQIDEATERTKEQDAARRRRGYSATVLTSPTGVGTSPVGTKTLLGS